MTHAYSELYIPDAKDTLSLCFDYLINDCYLNADWVSAIFVSSGYATQFERGNPAVLAGMSGIELAQAIVRRTYSEKTLPARRFSDGLSAEYWAGWALAQYQWYAGRRFKDIFAHIKLSGIILMYPIYHEMDISAFLDIMEKNCRSTSPTKLKVMREYSGLTQAELAAESGVKLRSIQMYEQRVNDIDRAQAQTVYKLAWAIGCDVEDLLENPMA